jgi:transmembrane sensor
MSAQNKLNSTVLDQAAEWTTIVDSGEMSEEQRLDFNTWVDEPHNARELGAMRTLVSLIQELPERKAVTLHRMPLAFARFPALTELFENPWRLSGATAAVLAILIVGAWFTFRPVREYFTQTYTTQKGESRTLVLKDGTVVHLNTESRVRWTGVGKDRRVALELGEVLFEVAHDATRPFVVTVGNSEIRDLATEFDVYRKSNGSVVVTVLSGQVAIKDLGIGDNPPAWAERQLKPNEQVEYTSASLIADVHSVDAAKAVRWREGLLETFGQSFSTVVNELNRYSNKQILIADPRVDGTRFKLGGALGIHDIPAALNFIKETAPVVVTDNGDSYVLTFKADVSVTEQSTAPQQIEAGHP